MAKYYSGPGSYKNSLYLIPTDAICDINNLNTGGDLLRRIFGSFYYYSTIPSSGDKSIALNEYTVEKVENLVGTEVHRITPDDCEQIQYAEINPARIQVIDKNVDIPNLKIPVRLYADKDNKSVKGDYHWKQFLFGGQYAGQTLPKRLNTENIHYDSTFFLTVPADYLQQEAYESLEVDMPYYFTKTNIFSNYYDYNDKVQKYQDWSNNLESELLMPNFYVVSEHFRKAFSETAMEDGLPGFAPITDEEAATREQINYLSNRRKIDNYHFPVGYYWKDLDQDQYFGEFFTETNTNSEFEQATLNSMQNIVFDQHYFQYVKDELRPASAEEPFFENSLDRRLSTFFNVQIKFDRHTNTIISRGSPWPDYGSSITYPYNHKTEPDTNQQVFRRLIESTNFSSRMLEILKDIDSGEITEISKKRLPFNYCITKDSFEYRDGKPSEAVPTAERPENSVGLHSMNFMDFLSYTYNNYNVALNDNYIFAGPSTATQAATMSDDTFYRTLNGASLINMIDGTKDIMKSYMSTYSPGEAAYLGADDISRSTQNFMEDIYGPGFKNQEVLAYKIEKMGGAVSGDSSEQNVIQKFWIYNSSVAPPEISFYDSQVKYGKEYTYKITAYALVLTHKYKYGDFRLTKQIGAADYLGDVDGTEYCLQFYNPENNMISPQLFASADLTLAEDSPLRTVISGMNNFAPNSVEISRHPQLLDFHLYLEPCVELIEVPLFQKSVKVMDSPCNSINVTPFHFIDNNNMVGFQVNQESFIKRPYPEVISAADLNNKMDYLKTKEIAQYNMIDIISESPARYIEMYRIRKKPNSFADFNDSLVATIDLRIKNEIYNFKNKIVSDQINTNTVYYYVFRFVNENGNPGPLSQIIQCELINDGGYTYSLFDTVDSSEFNPNQVATNSMVFKKIMQIDPNLSQLYFDDQEVDYQDFAQNQIGNLKVGPTNNKIWNKKFKIRLTSKKTSKKLDLNVTYDLVNRDLSKGTYTPPPPDYEPADILTSPELDDPPIDITIDSGIGDDSPISDPILFGRTVDTGDLGLVDLDFTPPAVKDGIVTSSDLHPAFSRLIREGTGFPVSLYRLLSGAEHSMTQDALDSKTWFRDMQTGYEFVQNFVQYHGTRGSYDRTTGNFGPAVVGPQSVASQFYDWVFNRRNAARLPYPLSKELTIVSALYLVNLIPEAHRALYGGGSAAMRVERRWTDNGSNFTRTKNDILSLTRLPFGVGMESKYSDFEGSEHCPEAFSMAHILSNLKQTPDMLDD